MTEAYEIGFGSQITVVPDARQFPGQQAVVVGMDVVRGDFQVVVVQRTDPFEPAIPVYPGAVPGALSPTEMRLTTLPGPVPYGDVATVIDGVRLTPDAIVDGMLRVRPLLSQQELREELVYTASITPDVPVILP